MGAMKNLDLSARELAAEHGRAEAANILSVHSAEDILPMYASGDLSDLIREPLSGEYADDLTPAALMVHLTGEPLSSASTLRDEVCTAYDEEYLGAAMNALESALHVDYPHSGGDLYDCAACELGPCRCEPPTDPEWLAETWCISDNCEYTDSTPE